MKAGSAAIILRTPGIWHPRVRCFVSPEEYENTGFFWKTTSPGFLRALVSAATCSVSASPQELRKFLNLCGR